MGLSIIKVLLILTLLNVITISVDGLFHENEANMEILTREANRQQYHTEVGMNEDYAKNTMTSTQQDEATAGNTMIFSKTGWDMFFDGFDSIDLDGSEYDNIIEKTLAIIISWLRGIMLTMNVVFFFLLWKKGNNA